MDALVIVAHPDDETIFCGGLLLRRARWHWTVLSLCRADDGDREPRFRRACRHLGARGIISDLDDGRPLAPIDPARDIAPRIRRHVGAQAWDLCITHGANGEYGHPRHRQVHAEVLRMARDGELDCRRLWTFALHCDSQGNCRLGNEADLSLALSAEELAEKRRIVRELYGFAPDSFEARTCTALEGFHSGRQRGGRRFEAS